MSRQNLFANATGRTPWRPWVQLREVAPRGDTIKHGFPFLTDAASKVSRQPEQRDWHWDDVRFRLKVLCDWLEKRLPNPVRTRKLKGGGKRVDLFNTVTYTFLPNMQGVLAGKLVGGRYEQTNWDVEIGKPLSSAWWLRLVIERLGLCDELQADLFNDGHDPAVITEWLADTAYRLLLREPLFRKLRNVTLPNAFDLPKDIHGIALASRIRARGAYLTSYQLNLVLKNLRAFKQVARENPQLLPLLYAYINQIPKGAVVNTKDPVMALKSAIRDEGLSEAAWRYLTRHGSRLFHVPWELDTQQSAFSVAMSYLRMLDYANLPPPPPPTVARALLHGYNDHRGHRVRISSQFEKVIDPVGLRLGLIEADKMRRQPGMAEFTEEFMGVCWWASEEWLMADKNQSKAGWPWMVKQWRKTEEERCLLASVKPQSFNARFDEFECGDWMVVPIRSSAELVRESLAMKNCLQRYMNDCEKGQVEIYSVREIKTGKRKACIGFKSEADRVYLLDIKGFANTPSLKDIEDIAHDMHHWMNIC